MGLTPRAVPAGCVAEARRQSQRRSGRHGRTPDGLALHRAGDSRKRWPDGTAQGSEGGPRRALPGCRLDLRAAPRPAAGAPRATTHRTWRRDSGPLTRDVQEAQPLRLQRRPRGQLLAVALHGGHRSPRHCRVSQSLRPARRADVDVRAGAVFRRPGPDAPRSSRGRGGRGRENQGRGKQG